jgi:hypothetical protein
MPGELGFDTGSSGLYRAVVSQIAKTMRSKRGLLEDGGAELGE